MLYIGDRIKEERKLLGLTQAQFAQQVGVQTMSQFNYEKGKRAPDAIYLEKAAIVGVDVLYIITGQRTPNLNGITNDEAEIIRLYRSAPLSVKTAIYGALTSTISPSGSTSISVSGSGQRIAGRDYNEKK
ncbi:MULTISPECIES: helix-turn-helix domain-containing protein [Arsenophonus]|uniref:helix-turn-helix domain-containing protein n=1 Tax=Arsenophonus TaxID=637 RepID=UPI003879AB96